MSTFGLPVVAKTLVNAATGLVLFVILVKY